MNTGDNMEQAEKCVKMLLENRYMDIATSQENNPWVSAVYYAVDPELNFYFVSLKDSRKGKNIQENSKVALSIYKSTNPPADADGVQIDGNAQIVKDQNLENAVHTMFSKRFKDKEKQQEYFNNYKKYAGDSNKKLFEVKTDKIYKVSGAYSRSKISKQKIKKRLNVIENETGLGKEHWNRV